MRATIPGLLVVAASSTFAHADVSGAWPRDMVTGGTDKATPSFRVYGRAGEHRVSPPAADAAGERGPFCVKND